MPLQMPSTGMPRFSACRARAISSWSRTGLTLPRRRCGPWPKKQGSTSGPPERSNADPALNMSLAALSKSSKSSDGGAARGIPPAWITAETYQLPSSMAPPASSRQSALMMITGFTALTLPVKLELNRASSRARRPLQAAGRRPSCRLEGHALSDIY